uniref:Uncharacterized protein n=1 Tax=Fagus sylvatica TaxID=28930 RepID=A0A2N9I2F6_FAGSY
MRDREREKKKPVGSCAGAPCSASAVLPASLRARAPCAAYRGRCHGGPMAMDRGGMDPWVVVLPFSLLGGEWQRIELVCVVCAVVQGNASGSEVFRVEARRSEVRDAPSPIEHLSGGFETLQLLCI